MKTATKNLPPCESCYMWKQPVTELDGTKRLLIPMANPEIHEYPFDYMFATPKLADEGLDNFDGRDLAIEEGWVLCRVETTPILKVIG